MPPFMTAMRAANVMAAILVVGDVDHGEASPYAAA